ncbi:MAG: hypothetical protein DCC71_02625 [Proteobacteria bacterium]|nr:MAG: hypothetical protein DCC71_02625 [Pseudomonadota bacterium]
MTRARLASALLTAYAAVLVVAALPPEVRPRWLDLPSEAGRIALRSLAIKPGVAVFETGRDDPRILVRQDCIRVVGRDAHGRETVFAPPDDRCITEGARLVIPWLEGGLRTLVLRSPPGLAEPLIGDWFCHGPNWAAYELREVKLVWTQPWVDMRSGEEGVANAAAFAWRCDPPGMLRRLIRPSDAELRAFEQG